MREKDMFETRTIWGGEVVVVALEVEVSSLKMAVPKILWIGGRGGH